MSPTRRRGPISSIGFRTLLFASLLSVPAELAGTPLEVAVFDLSGRRVKLLQGGQAVAGHHHVAWDLSSANGTRVHKGVYFMRTTIGSRTVTRKLLLVR